MNHEEIIEKIYEVDAVEGVAWFEKGGKLVENQLSISESQISQIGSILFRMRSDLSLAKRDLQGLVLRPGTQSFMCYMYGDSLVLLEVDSGSSLNEVYRSLKSRLGEGGNSESIAPPAQAEPAQVEPAAESAVEEGEISWEEFQKSVMVSLKKVAPAQLAKKMITECAAATGIPEGVQGINLGQATALATGVCEQVPNAARRKLVQKELQTLLSKYS